MPELNISYDDLKKVVIVDDKPEGREMLAECIEDAALEPMFCAPGGDSVKDYVARLIDKYDAAIFDHHLKPGNYAGFDGAEAVALSYQKKFPALLMTIYGQSDIKEIRPFRRNIPILIPGGEAEPNTIHNGFKQCLAEFSGHFTPERKPHRTLARVEEVHDDNLNIIVPQWNHRTAISISKTMIHNEIQPNLKAGTRLMVYVNIGASTIDQLYFENIQLADEPEGEYAKLIRS